MPRLGLLFITLVVSHTQAQSSTDFDQLDWVNRDQLSPEHQARLPEFCSGDYLPPSLNIHQGKSVRMRSDSADYHEQTGANFVGSVQLQQQGQQIQASSAHYDQLGGEAEFKGDVLYRNGDINMAADFLNYNSQTGLARLQNAQYVIAPLHLRGDASSLQINADHSVYLIDSSYTFCPPGHNDWDIKASEINLYQEKSYGEAFHARLRIKEVPILYLPYFRFPLGKDRLSGFLNPQISLSAEGVSNGGNLTLDQTVLNVEHFATPFYFNIAPNYDDTLTPRYLDGHGLLTENEFRYLNILGEGTLSVGYIGNDSTHISDTSSLTADEITDLQRPSERWSKSFHHIGNITQFWQDRVNYEEVSDADYSDDFSTLGLIDRSSFLKQNAELEYNDGSWQFLTLVEKTQTKDETLADTAQPYHRLPQVNLARLSSFETNQFNYDFNIEATRFVRDLVNDSGISTVDEIDGERFHSELTLSYPLENSWGFIKPSMQFMSTSYSFQNVNSTLEALEYKDEVSRDVHITSIDTGLYFERSVSLFQQDFVQTLEPRIMAAYIPYVDQSQIPIFDTTQTDFSYSQLFSPNRFTGFDRVGDTQQVTFGLTTRFLNDTGLEVFKASVGQIHYLEDRRVLLTPGDASPTDSELLSHSSYAGELQWLFHPGWRTKADIQFNPDAASSDDETTSSEKVEKASAQLNYQADNDWLFDLNFTFVKAASSTKAGTKQVGLAFFAPINDRWAFYAQKRQDIWSYDETEKLAKETVEEHYDSIEGIVGIEYQNCCWRVQATYEEHTRSDETKDYQYLIQVHFKGLGILGTDTDSMLGERILGYDEREIHDY